MIERSAHLVTIISPFYRLQDPLTGLWVIDQRVSKRSMDQLEMLSIWGSKDGLLRCHDVDLYMLVATGG